MMSSKTVSSEAGIKGWSAATDNGPVSVFISPEITFSYMTLHHTKLDYTALYDTKLHYTSIHFTGMIGIIALWRDFSL